MLDVRRSRKTSDERQQNCDIEDIKLSEINEAHECMITSAVRYRFVTDMASIR